MRTSVVAILPFILPLLASVTAARDAPKRLISRQSACFVVGEAALPEEVASGVAALAQTVACDSAATISPGVPNLVSGGVSLAKIDFQDSDASPLGFAQVTFAIPAQPSTISDADVVTLQDQLNDYLAWETAIRSQSASNSALLTQVKSVKFFLQFQQARINAAKGVAVDAAGTVEHQLGKVVKNAVGATQEEIDSATSLASQIS